jgi:hypothetical protein
MDFNKINDSSISYLKADVRQNATLVKISTKELNGNEYLTLEFEHPENGIAKIDVMNPTGKKQAYIEAKEKTITHILNGVFGKGKIPTLNVKDQNDWSGIFSEVIRVIEPKLPIECEIKLVLKNKEKSYVDFPFRPEFFSTKLNPCSDKFKKLDNEFYEVVKVKMDTDLPFNDELNTELPFGNDLPFDNDDDKTPF